MVNNNNNKNNNTYRVRAVSAMQPVIYDIPFSSIVEAYRDCLSNKRGTNSYTKFTVSYEGQLVWLWERIRTRTYKPGYSYTFIVDYPVTREIFAASFIDRVVHHFIALRIEPILERLFVDQGDVSKNCRKGQGNLKMVREVYDMIREESEGYTCDAYIFKGDFANFFMSIDKSVLWEMIDDFVRSNYDGDDIDCLLYLLSVTIFHCPQDRCIRKSPISAWKPLPNRKSLFYTERSKGMAIGNLPSQLLANFIASAFDQWIAHKGFRHYRRFCDDFVVVCKDKERLLRLVPQIDRYLDEQLHMALHPNKRYIQHYTKGVKMVGAVIKPWRIYISNRTVGKFYDKISRFNAAADAGLQERYVEKFVQTINSYLGMMVHYNTYNKRKHICNDLILPKWAGFLYFCNDWKKARVVGKYKTVNKTRKAIRKGSLSFAPELGANHKPKGK